MAGKFLSVVFACTVGIAIFAAYLYWQPLVAVTASLTAQARSAAVFFMQSITVDDLYDAYARESSKDISRVKVLIVPGHEPYFGGTEFGGYAERDIVVDIANELAALLNANPHYEVMVARTKRAWEPTLQAYFTSQRDRITDFIGTQTALMKAHMTAGRIRPQSEGQVDHNVAPSETRLHLYGINKWASENDIHITLHLHINDYAGRKGSSGIYEGFSIYVPERQYSNAAASLAVGKALAARLNTYHATSSMPLERAGVIEDQELIAIGSNNSADAVSMVIEYGYIYEPQFRSPQARALAVRDYAHATYLGLQDFFEGRP